MAFHISLFCKLHQERLFHFHKVSEDVSATLFGVQTKVPEPAHKFHLFFIFRAHFSGQLTRSFQQSFILATFLLYLLLFGVVFVPLLYVALLCDVTVGSLLMVRETIIFPLRITVTVLFIIACDFFSYKWTITI